MGIVQTLQECCREKKHPTDVKNVVHNKYLIGVSIPYYNLLNPEALKILANSHFEYFILNSSIIELTGYMQMERLSAKSSG